MSKFVLDWESPKGCFLACFYDVENDIYIDMQINKYRNDIYKFVKFWDDHKNDIFIGYNSLGFDAQLTRYILNNYENWFNLSGHQIAGLIHEFGGEVIDNGKYGLFPPYREEVLPGINIDIFKIQHFDNKNRRVGLKRLEYEMDAENIEEMGIPPGKEDFTEREIEDLIFYCHNDIKETYRNYLYIIGECENTWYKGSNEIEIREALKETFGFNCLNWSNSKYGDEIIKTLYCKEAGVKYEHLPKRGTFRKTISFNKGIPSHISFETKELSRFLNSIRDKEIKASDEFEEVVEFKGQKYTFALGGIHNQIENKAYDSDDEYVIIDADVTSYYVATILNNEYAPAHLKKKAFCNAYRWIYDERVRLKPLSKNDKKIKGVVSGYKEAGVAVYGKSGDMSNWLYDPQMRLNTCIAGELSILMLIEAQELANNQCIMANTDGATFYIKRCEINKFMKICEEWMSKTNYGLEFFTFKKLYFLSVNDYIGEWDTYYVGDEWKPYIDPVMGKIKSKGDFLTSTHLHKNKSFRAIPLALTEYFINGIKPEEYINSFDNIFHFTGRSSAGDNYTHTGWDVHRNEMKLPKLIRYYPAKEGIRIKKMVKAHVDTGARDTNLSPAELPKFVCNRLPKDSHEFHLNNVDRQWFIDKANEVIFRIEHGKKPKNIKKDPNQLNLF